MIAVVTGGTSFIGAKLLEELLRSGAVCYALVRPESKRLPLLPRSDRLHIVKGNLNDPASWASIIPSCDVFFHFAWDGVGAEGRANPEIQRRNVEMALTCLRAAGRLGTKRFLFSGSQAEYGPRDGIITEETSCSPAIEYGRAKLQFLEEAKKLSQEMNIEYVHLRIFSVYGPGDHPWTLVSRCLRAFSNGEETPLSSCEQMWNFLHVEDAAEAIYRLSQCDLQGSCVFNIASEDTRPLREFVNEIWQLCEKRGTPIYGGYQGGREGVHGIKPSIARMQAVTGWRQKKSFRDGIAEMVKAMEG